VGCSSNVPSFLGEISITTRLGRDASTHRIVGGIDRVRNSILFSGPIDASREKEETTPLEKRLDSLGRKLLWVTLLLIAIIAVSGIARGREVFIMIETAIALAVAAIPEGLPIVATLALARGMLRMARHNAMVNQLAAVETLGGVSVICTDKTGTLTENRMTVTDIYLSNERIQIGAVDKDGNAIFTINDKAIDPTQNKRLMKALEIGVLCNNASLEKNRSSVSSGIGDPLEIALLIAARKASIDYQLFIYEGAAHAFFNDTGARYHEEAAKLAWERTIAFFNQKLKT